MAIDRSSSAKLGIRGPSAFRRCAVALGILSCGGASLFTACGDDSSAPPNGMDGGSSGGSSGGVEGGRSSSGSSGSNSGSSTGGSTGSSSGGSSSSSGSGSSSGREAGPADSSSDTGDSAGNDANDADVVETGGGPADADLCVGDASALLDSSFDCCPNDPLKTQPGQCGCGVPDTDTDGDGVADCRDGCPKDRTRTAPGTCGCGVADNTPLCLVHRYSFMPVGDGGTVDAGPADGGEGGAGEAGVGSPIIDSVGGANGTTVNTTLTGNAGLVLLGGNSDQYVNLPAGIISSLGPSATFEAWVTWVGGLPWQRIFDFGSSDQPAGMQGFGATYIFATPLNSATSSLRAAFTIANGPGGEVQATYIAALPTAVLVQVAVVVDGTANTMSLFENGVYLGQATLPPAPTPGGMLASLADVNNWLGRSQFAPDPAFAGTYREFRIYSSARTMAQVMASATAGPGALPAQ
jgi:Concanavalin A-like lectin/glucanases superfamily